MDIQYVKIQILSTSFYFSNFSSKNKGVAIKGVQFFCDFKNLNFVDTSYTGLELARVPRARMTFKLVFLIRRLVFCKPTGNCIQVIEEKSEFSNR